MHTHTDGYPSPPCVLQSARPCPGWSGARCRGHFMVLGVDGVFASALDLRTCAPTPVARLCFLAYFRSCVMHTAAVAHREARSRSVPSPEYWPCCFHEYSAMYSHLGLVPSSPNKIPALRADLCRRPIGGVLLVLVLVCSMG